MEQGMAVMGNGVGWGQNQITYSGAGRRGRI